MGRAAYRRTLCRSDMRILKAAIGSYRMKGSLQTLRAVAGALASDRDQCVNRFGVRVTSSAQRLLLMSLKTRILGFLRRDKHLNGGGGDPAAGFTCPVGESGGTDGLKAAAENAPQPRGLIGESSKRQRLCLIRIIRGMPSSGCILAMAASQALFTDACRSERPDISAVSKQVDLARSPL